MDRVGAKFRSNGIFVLEVLAAARAMNAGTAVLKPLLAGISEVVEAFKATGTRNKVKIMVGGAPVTQEFCDSIGADYYTGDAASAAVCADEILSASETP